MKTILVIERCEDKPDEVLADDIFIIEKEYFNIDMDEYNKWYRIFRNATVETPTKVPVYDISEHHMVHGRYGQLHDLTLVGLQFHQYLEQFDAAKIICHESLDGGYQTVIKEVSEAASYDVQGVTHHRSKVDKIGQVITTSVLILPFLLDQLFTSFLYQFRPCPQKMKTVFVPSLGRITSMLPVIKNANFDNHVVVAANASSLWSTLTTKELKQFDPIPVSAYSSIHCIFSQIYSYVVITHSVLFNKQISEDLSSVIREESGLQLNDTVMYSVWNTFDARVFISFFKYILFRRMISQTEVKNIIVGGHDPGGLAIEHAALEEDCKPFHIPHSHDGYNSANPPSEIIQFISSHTEKAYRIDTPQIENQWTYRVTGRPYLTDIYNRRSEFGCENNDHLHLLVATQPISSSKEFVQEVLETVATDQKPWEVSLKIHPDENPDKYDELADQHSNVTIQDSDLFHHLANSDLTVTINSNVGLESIILGTPTVVLNMSKPIAMDPIYSIKGPVPSFETAESFQRFITETDEAELQELNQQQFEWAKESYKLTSDPTDEILRIIENYTG